MDLCFFCQTPVPSGTTTCPHCGQIQPPAPDAPAAQADADLVVSEGEGAAAPAVPLAALSDEADQTLPGQSAELDAEEAPQAAFFAEWPASAQPSEQPSYQEFPAPGAASQPLWPVPPGWLPPSGPASGAITAPPITLAPTRSRRRRLLRLIALTLAVLLVLGASGTLAYVLTRPMPVITVTGPEEGGALPAGSPDMVFQVQGRDFSQNAAITFLLDGTPAPGAPATRSDSMGNVQVALPITDLWVLGQHALTARDAQGYTTKAAVLVMVLAAPVLSVISPYAQGSLPAGSTGTALDFSGKRFALDTTVTLLLDGMPLDTLTPIMSDSRGRISGMLSVSADWPLGTHSLTAQDAVGNMTKTAAALVIVPQGEAGTPGPNGAPPDDKTFGLTMTVTAKDTSGQAIDFSQFIIVTGHPDPAGGTPCSPQDTGPGQSQTYTGTLDNSTETFTEMITLVCQGTYMAGQVLYIEMGISDIFVLGSGMRCVDSTPYIYAAYQGNFTSAGAFSGVYYRDYFQADCPDGSAIYRNSAAGTWTGEV